MRMMQEHLVSLLWRNDRMGMIASIESRFPFLGDSMMRFAFNLPLKYKIGRISRFYNYKHPFLIDKCIVRKASQPYLPEQLVYKKKNGFPLKGVAHFRPDAAFFKGGILQSSAGLRDRDLDYFLSTTDKYILGKFVSLETFHKLFIQRMDTTTVEDIFRKHVKLV
jgi:asparagine synthase (glutamine-hydrolysing)